MYQVLARTWRPQRFDELVGQGHVARTLANAIRGDRLAHAYVFAGQRGTGKTTVARILAKCLNCTKGPTVEPCGTCDACVEITESRSLDVMEIDAASRTGVADTRELMEIVAYAPVRDRYKVLIIDEAHMLSKASFNALLKTLEEPPPRVVFVLATTELQKIIPTILSRCQLFEFRRVAVAEVVAHLRRVADSEKLRISEIALERVAHAGEGSIRDSLSVLERVIAFCGKEVDDDDVIRSLGSVRGQVLVDFFTGLAARDAAAMLSVLDALVDEGHDLVHFWAELIAALRDLLLLDALPQRRDLVSRPADEVGAIHEAAAGLGRDDLLRAFQLVADLEPGLRGSSRPRFLFEAALIRLAALGAVRPIEEVISSLGLERNSPIGRTVPPPRKPLAARPEPPQKKKAADPTPGSAAELIASLQTTKPIVGAMLAEASRVTLDGAALEIELPAHLEALAKQLARPEHTALLAREGGRLRGADRVEVRIKVGAVDEPAPPAKAPTGERPAPQGSNPARPLASPALSPELLDAAQREPGVRELIDAFGAQVVDVRPLPVAPPVDDGTNSEEKP